MIRALATLVAPVVEPVVVPVVVPEPEPQLFIVPIGTYTDAQYNALPAAEQGQYSASYELQVYGAEDRDHIVTYINAPASLSKLQEMQANWAGISDLADEPLKAIALENATVLLNNAAKQQDGLQVGGMEHLRTEVAEFAALWAGYALAHPDARASFSDWL